MCQNGQGFITGIHDLNTGAGCVNSGFETPDDTQYSPGHGSSQQHDGTASINHQQQGGDDRCCGYCYWSKARCLLVVTVLIIVACLAALAIALVLVFGQSTLHSDREFEF